MVMGTWFLATSIGNYLAGRAAGLTADKGFGDQVRTDKPGKNARDGYVTEHTEIAAYELLERLALRAGDQETARVVREICKDEEEMARWIAARWEKFVDLTLADAGFPLEQTVHVGR